MPPTRPSAFEAPARPAGGRSRCAGLLLTGGASRRMGRAKAAIALPGGITCAGRLADLLATVAAPVLEVGGAYTELEQVPDDLPGEGPLAALASGRRHLIERGWSGPAVVLSCDLPLLGPGLLGLLAAAPAEETVVPVVGGRDQPLAARYAPDALDTAVLLVRRGVRRLSDLLAAVPVRRLGPEEWQAVAGPAEFDDLDRPEDLVRLGLDTVGPRLTAGPVPDAPAAEARGPLR